MNVNREERKLQIQHKIQKLQAELSYLQQLDKIEQEQSLDLHSKFAGIE